jgi:pimeloyl-ACP methyl ester carboxylesterase
VSSGPWRLRERTRLSGGEVAHDQLGDGPHLVLVHGTPTWSFLWRQVAPVLASQFTVHMFDLLGYGDSQKGEELDVSIAAQARMLVEMLDLWGLKKPLIAGHDIGGAIVLRAHLIEGRDFERMALVDAVVFNPWLTRTTTHIRAHLETYRAMSGDIFGDMVRTHLRTAVRHRLDDATLEAYMAPWRGSAGQSAYLHKIAQFEEADTAVLEPLLSNISAPTLILWGEEDGWIAPAVAERLHRAIASSRVSLIPGAGHFCAEDEPEAVARELSAFFGAA